MIRIVYLFLAFAARDAMSQEGNRIQLNGKVTADVFVPEGFYVINKITEKAAITDQDGNFSIMAAVGDTLLFSAVQLKETKIILTQVHFDQGILFAKVTPIVNQLREVIVRKGINAVSIGVIPTGQKT